MGGRIGPVSAYQLYCGGAGNADRLAALHAYWQQAHTQAGPHYWPTCSWTLLIWQPIYFSVLAIHLGRRAEREQPARSQILSQPVLETVVPCTVAQRDGDLELEVLTCNRAAWFADESIPTA
jgi:hypothetical protein